MVDIPEFTGPSASVLRDVCVAVNSENPANIDQAFSAALRHYGRLSNQRKAAVRTQEAAEVQAALGDPAALRKLAAKRLAARRK